jgi:hypothetical protein
MFAAYRNPWAIFWYFLLVKMILIYAAIQVLNEEAQSNGKNSSGLNDKAILS